MGIGRIVVIVQTVLTVSLYDELIFKGTEPGGDRIWYRSSLGSSGNLEVFI